jgi:hypothetical protein
MGQALSSCGGNMDGAGIQRLFSAIREHDVQSVETLATEEPKLVNDSVFYIRTTPLHLAASLGQLEVSSTTLAPSQRRKSTCSIVENAGISL